MVKHLFQPKREINAWLCVEALNDKLSEVKVIIREASADDSHVSTSMPPAIVQTDNANALRTLYLGELRSLGFVNPKSLNL